MTEGSNELGDALRRWRDRISPAAVGLPASGPRRAVGLRREELAGLAGVSVDYLTRLEQGRAVHPSDQVLHAISRGLRLSADESAHLFALARRPGAALVQPGHVSARLTPGVQRLLDRLDDVPVAVSDAAWTVIAWNPLWAALMGDLSAARGRDRNTLWRHFTGQRSRVVYDDAQLAGFESSAVADLRAATARYPADDGLRRLVADLRRASPAFTRLWETHDVATHDAGHKTIDHPEVGRLTLDCDALTVHGSNVRVVAYTAEPGSVAAGKLALLRVIGTQRLTGEPG